MKSLSQLRWDLAQNLEVFDTHTHTRTHTRAHTRAHTHTNTHTHTRARTHTDTYLYAEDPEICDTHTHTHTNIHNVCMYIYTFICILYTLLFYISNTQNIYIYIYIL
jgi:hypothetical protein